MNGTSMTAAGAGPEWNSPDRGRVAMLMLIAAEAAIFTIFVVAYVFYLGKSLTGPMPKDVLSVPIVYTICLLSSSLTIHFAAQSLRRGGVLTFGVLWLATIKLGAAFLDWTGTQLYRLIYKERFTISTKLLRTTYYPFGGLRSFHVILVLFSLTIV